MSKEGKIINVLIKQNPRTEKSLSRAKRALARDFGIGIATNNWLLKIYRKALAEKKIKFAPWLENVLIKRRTRTLSGVAPVTVATKPYPCPGRCIYCPTDIKMPKSYLPSQPAAARALRFKYHPYKQVQGRLQAFYNNGHCPEKVELRILGGTWSYYPRRYQMWFVKGLYRGLNEFDLRGHCERPKGAKQSQRLLRRSLSLAPRNDNIEKLQKINERAKHRCVGLSIETRPDYINLDEIKRLRKFGVTKIELGVQHLDQKILDFIKRDQTKNQVKQATKLLRDAGFKICYHIMPNLPGSTPRRDLAMFKEIFDDGRLRPDQLKIYPCVVLKNTLLCRWYKQGKYKTYTDKVLIDLLARMKKYVPAYARIERIYRDVPSCDIVDGCKHLNIREMAQKVMWDQGVKCGCIRCREVRDKIKNQISKIKNINQKSKIFIEKYNASNGREYFISFESHDRKILYAFLRLRFPSDDTKNQLSILRNTAIIRELHTYGKLIPISQYPNISISATQHKGLGKKLLAKAEQIAKSHKYAKIAVISAIGVKGYYRKLGYRMDRDYGYMVKNLTK